MMNTTTECALPNVLDRIREAMRVVVNPVGIRLGPKAMHDYAMLRCREASLYRFLGLTVNLDMTLHADAVVVYAESSKVQSATFDDSIS